MMQCGISAFLFVIVHNIDTLLQIKTGTKYANIDSSFYGSEYMRL